MTVSQGAITGAVVLNLPTFAWTDSLPWLTVVVAACGLALAGAALGGLFAWSVTEPSEPAVVVPMRRRTTRVKAAA
jgi:hypothetical protein